MILATVERLLSVVDSYAFEDNVYDFDIVCRLVSATATSVIVCSLERTGSTIDMDSIAAVGEARQYDAIRVFATWDTSRFLAYNIQLIHSPLCLFTVRDTVKLLDTLVQDSFETHSIGKE